MRTRRSLATLLALILVTTGTVTAGSGSPATAATPDVWAFATLTNPTPVAGELLNRQYQSGTWHQTCPSRNATVSPAGTGVYRVLFPCSASANGIVHVTAIGAVGQFCAAAKWIVQGADERVTVRCFNRQGALANAMFSVLYTTSSGTPGPSGYAYAFVAASGSLTTSVAAAGGTNTATRTATGTYAVRLYHFSDKLAGDLQVTAMTTGTAGRRCNIGAWGMEAVVASITVHCYTAAGALVNSAFTVSFHAGRPVTGGNPPPYWAYLWWHNGTLVGGTSATSDGAPNEIQGHTLAFPDLGQVPSQLQITAFSPTSAYCGPSQPWENDGYLIAKDVACYAPAGATSDFFATAVSDAPPPPPVG